MNISSNTLFHFTTKFSYLKNILSDGFWPRYCREYAWNGFDFAVPMTCFCDIPLSQIINHTDNYGGYGIGMKKTWAKGKGITPVMYIANDSKLSNQVNYKIKSIGNGQKNYNIDDFFLLHYIKKVRGETICKDKDGNKIKKQVNFYNEREWRYIPTSHLRSGDYMPVFLKRSEEFENSKYDSQTLEHKLKFDIEDISYIIIKAEGDRSDMIKAVNKIFSEKSEENRQLLTSRILSLKQIKEDF